MDAGVTIEEREGSAVAVLRGDWTSTSLGSAGSDLADAVEIQPQAGPRVGGVGQIAPRRT